jgi:predicted carbohydrate-binding protein with CBM5 and CBM33 domain
MRIQCYLKQRHHSAKEVLYTSVSVLASHLPWILSSSTHGYSATAAASSFKSQELHAASDSACSRSNLATGNGMSQPSSCQCPEVADSTACTEGHVANETKDQITRRALRAGINQNCRRILWKIPPGEKPLLCIHETRITES